MLNTQQRIICVACAALPFGFLEKGHAVFQKDAEWGIYVCLWGGILAERGDERNMLLTAPAQGDLLCPESNDSKTTYSARGYLHRQCQKGPLNKDSLSLCTLFLDPILQNTDDPQKTLIEKLYMWEWTQNTSSNIETVW